jgi:hypothetical protein
LGLSELLAIPLAVFGEHFQGVEFRGIVRPSPALVLLRPTARYFFVKSICPHVDVLISASRIPAFSASDRAGKMCGERDFWASASILSFSSGV